MTADNHPVKQLTVFEYRGHYYETEREVNIAKVAWSFWEEVQGTNYAPSGFPRCYQLMEEHLPKGGF